MGVKIRKMEAGGVLVNVAAGPRSVIAAFGGVPHSSGEYKIVAPGMVARHPLRGLTGSRVQVVTIDRRKVKVCS